MEFTPEGFPITTPEYVMFLKVFSLTPRPSNYLTPG